MDEAVGDQQGGGFGGPAAGVGGGGAADVPRAARLERALAVVRRLPVEAFEDEAELLRKPVGAIKAELKASGVPSAALLEKAELVEALREAW